MITLGMAIKIKNILTEVLSPSYLEIINDSHLHAGHQDFANPNETHFTVIIESPLFLNASYVQKHRMVLGPLKPLFELGLHSIVVKVSKIK